MENSPDGLIYKYDVIIIKDPKDKHKFLIDKVDEISSIKIDKRKFSNERILGFLSKIKNPYIFKVSNKLVKIIFSDNNRTADESLTSVLENLYR